MLVFRLCSRKHPPDSGEGASRYGGRWNLVGTPVVYTSATRSLAPIEVIAHNGAIPGDYRVFVIDIPDDLAIETVSPKGSPRDPFTSRDYAKTAKLGTEWANSGRSAVLKVPSAAIKGEHNYILNPRHPDIKRIRFTAPRAERIDSRLRK